MASPKNSEPQYESDEERKRLEKGDKLLEKLFGIRPPMAPDDLDESEEPDQGDQPAPPPKK